MKDIYNVVWIQANGLQVPKLARNNHGSTTLSKREAASHLEQLLKEQLCHSKILILLNGRKINWKSEVTLDTY